MPQQYVAICTCGKESAFDSQDHLSRLSCPMCLTPLLAAAALRALGEDEHESQFAQPTRRS